MRVVAQHPCPVRIRTPRGRDRLTYLALRTAVEVPELSEAEFGSERTSYEISGTVTTLAVHAGRCWEPVSLKRHRWPGDADPVTAEGLAANLARRTQPPHGIATPGTPLCGAPLGVGDAGLHGEDIPDRTLARAVSDCSDTVRAAFGAWAASELAIVDGVAWVARGLPVLVTAGPRNPCERPPGTWAQGATFAPPRIDRYPAYLAALRQYEGSDRFSLVFRDRYGHLPDTRGDLRLFANAAPREACAALDRARPKLAADAARDLDAVFAPLAALGDLGLVRAVPEARYGEVAERVASALGRLLDAIPDGYRPSDAPKLLAYAETVAVPELAAAPLPEADADSLGDLAPG